MNDQFSSPRSSPLRAALQIGLIVVAVGFLLHWGASAVRSFLLRPIPWSQWAVLHVWTSLAVDPGASGSGQADAELPTGLHPTVRPAGGGGLRRTLAVAQVYLEEDVAAARTRSETRLPIVLPAKVMLLPGDLTLTLKSVARDGTMVLRFDGREHSLPAGLGLDWALTPSATPGGWVVQPGNWREVILSRLEAGLPVGRVSMVNQGLLRKSGGAAALWVGPDYGA